MIKFVNHPEIGYGIYTVTDAASLLRLPVSKVRYWINKFWDEQLSVSPESKYSWGDGRGKSVNFYTLMEFFVFYQLREQGISVHKILKTHQFLSKKFDIAYPFASYQIMSDGKSILFSPDAGDSIVTATPKLQYNLTGIIGEFVEKIEFTEDNQLAVRFFPDGKTSSVVIDPERQFGQPIIEGTNILAKTIYSMHKGGETDEFIAEVYSLLPSQVNDAVTYFRKSA
jgi:uncharacterized protein (DUF433 family)